MKKLHRHLMLATALATGLAITAPLAAGLAQAQEKSTVTTNPGFKPGGQINPGETIAAPSSSIDIRKIPSHADAVTALMAEDNPVSALGPDTPNSAPAAPQAPKTENKTTSPENAKGDVTTATQGQAAIGGPMSPGASSGGGSNGPAASGAPPQAAATETTGVGNRAADPHRPGPIGSTGQTLPAKFSQRNDVLDRLPIMAWPQRLTAEERQQVFKAVMADKAPAVGDADAL